MGQQNTAVTQQHPQAIRDEDLSSMCDRIHTAMVPLAGEGSTGFFFPRSELERICSRACVHRELERLFGERAQEYTDYVCGSMKAKGDSRHGRPARQIYAILASVGSLDKVDRFLEAGVSDEDLPFLWDDMKTRGKLLTKNLDHITGTRRGGGKACFLENETTFKEDFDRELYALRKVDPGPHVVELCATFKRGRELSFLFPWAQGGSLAELMKRQPLELVRATSNPCKTLILWIATQCEGLATGLGSIHVAEPEMPPQDTGPLAQGSDEYKRSYGIHGDIKPDNMLYFSSQELQQRSHHLGTIKLADFGLTRFFTRDSRPKQPGSRPMSETYASPEHYMASDGVSRKADVWALGCVFTELLTWVARGPEAVRGYGRSRLEEKGRGPTRLDWDVDTFCGKIFSESGPIKDFPIKQAVDKCIEENRGAVSSDYPDENYVAEFLDFVRKRMLETDRAKRADCEEVYNYLRKARERLQDDDRYCPDNLGSLGCLANISEES
ncbi:hypothetical protein ACJZ2D_015868 [Fusarium nematophilum]